MPPLTLLMICCCADVLKMPAPPPAPGVKFPISRKLPLVLKVNCGPEIRIRSIAAKPGGVGGSLSMLTVCVVAVASKVAVRSGTVPGGLRQLFGSFQPAVGLPVPVQVLSTVCAWAAVASASAVPA